MTISDEEVDRQVTRFRAAANAATSNLLELESLETLQLVHATTFTGATAAPAAHALAALATLIVLQPRLLEFTERLEQLRGRGPRAGRTEMGQIEQLLTGRSITLPPRPIELDDRSLFTPAEVADQVTPDQLIAMMNDLFVPARSTLMRIDETWQRRLTQIVELREQVATMLGRAKDLGEPTDRLTACDRMLRDLSDELAHDPLGTAATLDAGLATEIEAIRSHLDIVEGLRRDLPAQVDAAAQQLVQVIQLFDETDATATAAQAQVAGAVVEQPDRAALHDERVGLIPWLNRLRELEDEGRWRAARVGLDRWLATLATVKARVNASLETNRAPLRRRDELRGLLDSYQTIAGTDLDADPEIRRWHDAARGNLYGPRTDLVDAAEQVRNFVEVVRRR